MLKDINPTNVVPSYIADFYAEYKGIHELKTQINRSIVLKVGKVYYVKLNREDGFKAIKILGGFLALDGSIGGCQMVYIYKTTGKQIKATFSNQFEHAFETKKDYVDYAKTGKPTYTDLCCNHIGFYNLWSVLAQVFPKTFELLTNVTSSNLYSIGDILKRDSELGDFKIYQYNQSYGKVVNVDQGVGIKGLWIDENGEHLVWDECDKSKYYHSKEECFEAEFRGIDDDFGEDDEQTNKCKKINVNLNITILADSEEIARKVILDRISDLL